MGAACVYPFDPVPVHVTVDAIGSSLRLRGTAAGKNCKEKETEPLESCHYGTGV